MPGRIKTQKDRPAGRVSTIRWLQWGPEVFERARREDKLILFDSGAKWCHWCHVMDHVTYEDEEVVRLVNERFVPVRIDRDRLPDVDAKYQRDIPIIRSTGNGWPLTVIITPEGHTLYKATFLPPRADGRYGAPAGLIDLLERVEAYWRESRRDIATSGEYLRRSAAQQRDAALVKVSQPTGELIDEIFAGIKAGYDDVHGGFGRAPKFYSAPAVELALVRAFSGDGRARDIAVKTLESVARGGVYDHVGGGFHRYSVDRRWHVPHFEKMAYDNAALLALYSNAHAMTGNHDFARVARETLRWVSAEMAHADGEGFFASQDADTGPGDDGDYFTWTLAEARAVLGDEADAAISYFAIDSQGDVHDRPGRNVLHAPKTIRQLAALLETDEKALAAAVRSAGDKLLAARRRRQTPAIDRTVFADLNGMMIDAHLTAYERLGDVGARVRALKMLDYLLENLRDERGVFAHYSDGQLRNVGLLADQAWMAAALVHAYAVTIEQKYLDAAVKLADYVLAELTAEDGGFFTKPPAGGPADVAPERRWEDAPTRSAASVAAEALLDLAYLSGRQEYADAAAKALASFAGVAGEDWGTFLGGYALALDRLLNGPRVVVVVGRDCEETRALAAAARSAYLPGGLVLALDTGVGDHAALLERLGHPAAEEPTAYVCRAAACLAPARTREELMNRIDALKQP